MATWTRNIGLIIILFVIWQLWGTSFSQHRAQARLGSQFASLLQNRPADDSTVSGSHSFTVKVAPTLPGSVLAEIRIPRIGVKDYVVEGTGEAQLDEAPGHYVGTPLPGQAGNSSIAGHRTTYGAPFYRLGQLTVGDVIYTTTTQGTATYTVSEAPFAVSPSDTAVLNDFGDNRLTLTTCNPPYSSTSRLIVVATLTKAPSFGSRKVSLPSAPVASPVAPKVVARAGNVGWHMGQLPGAIALGAVLVALGLLRTRLRRALGGVGFWLVLSPVWIAALLLLFEALGRLLPVDL